MGSCLLLFALQAYGGLANDRFGLALLSGLFVLALYPHRRESLGLMLVFIGVAVYAIPYAALLQVSADVPLAWFSLFIPAAVLLARLARVPDEAMRAAPDFRAGPAWMLALLAAGLLLSGTAYGSLLFMMLGGAALVPFERLCAATGDRFRRLAALLLFWAAIGLYCLFAWNGAGRIVIAGYALAPLLIAARYRALPLPAPLFAAAAAALPFLGELLRWGRGGWQAVASGSATAPILTTSYVWQTGEPLASQTGLLDQWLLMAAGWVPRAVWPDKPIGVGFTFVDDVLGREGFAADHSTALGLGEHIYLGGSLWWLSLALMLAALALMRRAIGWLSGPWAAAIIAFDVALLSLFWGGMATFGARLWFTLVPALALILLFRRAAQRPGGGAGWL